MAQRLALLKVFTRVKPLGILGYRLIARQFINARTVSFLKCRNINNKHQISDTKSSIRNASKVARSKQKTRHEAFSSEILHHRYIFVETSTDLWIDVERVVFDVCYLDSLDSLKETTTNSRMPTVVALHDVRGNFKDLEDIVTPLIKLGCRVVIPALPGSVDTKGDDPFDDRVFSHTAHEKAAFVLDFLLTLGVEKVDLLITSGSSSHAGTLLCVGQQNMFRSLAMISPWGVRNCRGMKPTVFYHWMEDSQEWRFSKMLSFFATWGLALVGNGSWSHRQSLALARNNIGCQFSEFGGNCVLLHKKEHPTCVIYTNGDTHIDEDISAEVMTLLSIPQSSLTVCRHDNTDKLTQEGSKYKARAYKLEGYGENYLQTGSGVIAGFLLDLLKSVKHIS